MAALKALTAIVISLWSLAGVAGDSSVAGRIVDVTSNADGLLVRIDAGVPTNCSGALYNSMLIPEANRTMIATALIAWQNESGGTVYTDGLVQGQCRINQFDPR